MATQHISNAVRASVETAAQILSAASYPIALTGAGISVPSGIPDFRSPGSGMWEKYNPAIVASIRGFRSDPARFYEWIRPLVETKIKASPNPAHTALTRLQRIGKMNEIITQNIDGLHEGAGSERVLPLHGHTMSATCLGCGATSDTKPLWKEVVAGSVPHCDSCGGVYKPDVVLFGEMLPDDLLWQAQQATAQADVMLVAGSSLEVFPVAAFPKVLLAKGGKLIIVNIGETEYDDEASVAINADVALALPAIADLLEAN